MLTYFYAPKNGVDHVDSGHRRLLFVHNGELVESLNCEKATGIVKFVFKKNCDLEQLGQLSLNKCF